ncbi:hypothetical protein Desde_4203 [Desulfitobacterium dehalogenans ATCC 51507]|uniref:Uncharacterized protein n=1 Tax=Desulfitobacterium dehalogenans (strain ATCC 51507 / DSM 9161 / JW/IU-DC1) TaxID=756499 RepID=I4AES9_DESDJ|nr:hypothetical protein Desde_4203 [Desulfitobacterium dehalogenans ATCC 51507]
MRYQNLFYCGKVLNCKTTETHNYSMFCGDSGAELVYRALIGPIFYPRGLYFGLNPTQHKLCQKKVYLYSSYACRGVMGKAL